jgi:hypothetical protein
MHVSQENEDVKSFTNTELSNMFDSIPAITQQLCISNDLKQKYEQSINGDNDDKDDTINMKDTDDLCPICLDDLNNGDELDYCKSSCQRAIHKECFSMWIRFKPKNCIYCMKPWNNKRKKNNSDYINLKD